MLPHLILLSALLLLLHLPEPHPCPLLVYSYLDYLGVCKVQNPAKRVFALMARSAVRQPVVE
jgi:hypothetical protein